MLKNQQFQLPQKNHPWHWFPGDPLTKNPNKNTITSTSWWFFTNPFQKYARFSSNWIPFPQVVGVKILQESLNPSWESKGFSPRGYTSLSSHWNSTPTRRITPFSKWFVKEVASAPPFITRLTPSLRDAHPPSPCHPYHPPQKCHCLNSGPSFAQGRRQQIPDFHHGEASQFHDPCHFHHFHHFNIFPATPVRPWPLWEPWIEHHAVAACGPSPRDLLVGSNVFSKVKPSRKNQQHQ